MTVFAAISMSIDGYLAPEGMDMEHFDQPEHLGWFDKWMSLQSWVFPQAYLRERLGLGEGGETGPDNDLLAHTFQRTGANIMGRRMFDAGERSWPEEAPFRTPVFVLTHRPRDPWERPGGTTFHFVTGGVEEALERASVAAGDLDVRISGGAHVIAQYLSAGLLEEVTISVAPVVFGGGRALFSGVDPSAFGLEIADVVASPRATHLTYRVTPSA